MSTKLTVLRALAAKVDALIVGGGIANTFILAANGRIGKSLVEADLVGEARAILDAFPGKVPIPVDVVCAKEFSATAAATEKAIEDVEADDMILDVGADVGRGAQDHHRESRDDRLERPVGVFEFDAFAAGTKALAEAIAASPRVLDRRRRRHRRRDQQVRRRGPDLVHLDGRRRVPRISRRQDAARGRSARSARDVSRADRHRSRTSSARRLARRGQRQRERLQHVAARGVLHERHDGRCASLFPRAPAA